MEKAFRLQEKLYEQLDKATDSSPILVDPAELYNLLIWISTERRKISELTERLQRVPRQPYPRPYPRC